MKRGMSRLLSVQRYFKGKSGKPRWALAAFLLNLTAGIFSFAWAMIGESGLFSVAGDFNVQQIPFAMYANDAIKSGNVIWDWSLDLGSNFIGGMAFYILGNPSFYLSLLFPSDMFMYVVGWFYVLKYAFAGLISYYWLKRFVKHKENAVIASMMYAFSGFMNEDLLFYHFHDVVLLFPLMLIALDRIMEEKKYGGLIFATLLNAIVNYFFLPGEIIFLAAYFILRYVVGNGREEWKRLPRVLFEGALGCLMGCALLLPAAVFTLQNPRVSFDYWGNNSLFFSTERYLFILKSMIFPGEVMSDQSAVIESNFSSCAAYIPMCGMVLVIAFCVLEKGRKHWLKRMLLFALICAVVPIFNAAYSLFAGLYHRWYYMPVLLFALCGALVLDRMDRDARVWESPTPSERAVSKGTVIWGIVTIAFILFLLLVPWSESDPSKIYHMDVFVIWSCVAVAGTLFTWLILTQVQKHRKLFFTLGIYGFAILTTVTVLALYHDANGEQAEELYDRIETSKEFIDPSPDYRYANRDNPEALTHGYPQSANFCSTVSGSIFRFYESLGLERDVKSPDAPEGMMNLISARYYYSTEPVDDKGALIRTVKGESRTYYIYEDSSIPPIGFTYDTYMTASEFEETSVDNRAILMLKTLVVPDDLEEKIAQVLRHYDRYVDGAATEGNLREISADHLEECAKDVEQTTSSYAVTIQADSDKYAFFSIPDDDGWSATVDGEEAEIVDINGFMAVRIHAGENRVEFHYTVPGLKPGIALTVLAVLISAIYILRGKKAKPAK